MILNYTQGRFGHHKLNIKSNYSEYTKILQAHTGVENNRDVMHAIYDTIKPYRNDTNIIAPYGEGDEVLYNMSRNPSCPHDIIDDMATSTNKSVWRNVVFNEYGDSTYSAKFIKEAGNEYSSEHSVVFVNTRNIGAIKNYLATHDICTPKGRYNLHFTDIAYNRHMDNDIIRTVWGKTKDFTTGSALIHNESTPRDVLEDIARLDLYHDGDSYIADMLNMRLGRK